MLALIIPSITLVFRQEIIPKKIMYIPHPYRGEFPTLINLSHWVDQSGLARVYKSAPPPTVSFRISALVTR